jgi:carbamoyl-phosphate synthase small subunit
MTTGETPAILLLEDGTIFKGKAAGKIGTTIGEICFNTSMTGYQEVFTDPSYYGQILIMTNVHIGNYGCRNEDQESGNVQIAGLVTRDFTIPYSREMADESIEDYAVKQELVGITQVDTRALVTYVRNKGAMNVIISSETEDIDVLKKKLKAAPSMEGLELASVVSTKEPYTFGDENASYRVAVMDYGTKLNILRSLASRDMYLKVFPAKTSFEEIQKFSPNGYFLSNGPGDPSSMDYAVSNVKKMLATGKPIFGICLGHQLLSLGLGIGTYKMHHGHRGSNHPVKNVLTGLCEITSQNHGFGVDPDQVRSKKDEVDITHINLNDDTIEGIKVKGKPIFSVQFHPEASPGPHDSRYLFDEFKSLLDSNK